MFLEADLVDKDEVVALGITLRLSRIMTQLLQAGHFLRQIDLSGQLALG